MTISQSSGTKLDNLWNFLPKDLFWHFVNSKGLIMTFLSNYKARDWFWQVWKVEGLKLPIMQHFVRFSFVFDHFAYKTRLWDIFIILMHSWVFSRVLAVKMVQKWWVFTHSSIPHTRVLLVPSNHLWSFWWKKNLFTKSHHFWSSQVFRFK